ncbi:MAG: hypothetical protein ACM3PY_03300 [Omnitrophica WOR_2 bacterium]
MSKLPGSLDDFISEISASLEGSSGEVVLRRINTERVLHLALEEIVQQRHDLQIRVLADSRIAGQSGADLLMQIDDYEIRLALIDAPVGNPELIPGQLNGFRGVFEENPSTEVMVLTWTTEDLLSQKLNLEIIEYLIAHPDQIAFFLEKSRPLNDVIADILASHMKVWDFILEPPAGGSFASGDISKLFEDHFKKNLEMERERSFKNIERKAAALRLDEKKEISILNNALEDALQGQLARSLASRLTQFTRRGGK